MNLKTGTNLFPLLHQKLNAKTKNVMGRKQPSMHMVCKRGVVLKNIKKSTTAIKRQIKIN